VLWSRAGDEVALDHGVLDREGQPNVRVVLGARGTNPELDAGGARDILWTLNSPGVYHLLPDRGRADARYEIGTRARCRPQP
jgi:hypothetical protein